MYGRSSELGLNLWGVHTCGEFHTSPHSFDTLVTGLDVRALTMFFKAKSFSCAYKVNLVTIHMSVERKAEAPTSAQHQS